MGAWGYGILESDNALDFEDELNFMLNGRVKDLNVADTLKTVISNIEEIDSEYDYGFDKAVAYQVLLVTILGIGAQVERSTFEQIMEGVRGGEYAQFKTVYKTNGVIKEEDIPDYLCTELDWYNGRMNAIENLLVLADSYDIKGGMPVVVSNKGLLDTIMDRMNNN